MSDQIFFKIGFSLVTAIIIPVIAYYVATKLEQRDVKLAKKGRSNLEKYMSKKDISELDVYEYEIASLICDEKMVKWEDIGGLDSLLLEIRKRIINPFLYFHKLTSLSNSLITAPKGMLLYGDPGCGKTMIAKAIASQIDCPLILIDVATISDKWYGETEKLVRAIFSLALKMQPCIIFIDEIDCLLRTRDALDHEVTSRLKSIFLTQMDGFISNNDNRILLIGATNRIDSLDKAILRRMPNKFHVPKPAMQQRANILQLLLKDIPLAQDVNLEEIAKSTEHFTGSDLKELCRNALSLHIYDHIDKISDIETSENDNNKLDNFDPRDQICVRNCDFTNAILSHTSQFDM